MTNLATSVGSIPLTSPIMNASGVWCMTNQQLVGIAESKAAAVMFKSMTLNPREGNERTRMYFNSILSVNSMGLPNKGAGYYCETVKQMHHFKKPMFASITGFCTTDFFSIFDLVNKAPFDAIEINLSCPNIEGRGIFAYDRDESMHILDKIRKKTKKTIGVKLPPYNQRSEIEVMAKSLVDVGIDFITLINSYPLGCFIDYETEQMAIRPNDGIGGLGGSVVKPIALSQIVLFRQHTKDKVSLIGVGGVEKGSDIYEYVLAGASAVQIGTALWREGPAIFGRLEHELNGILREKKVKTIREKIGALKMK